MLSLCTNSTRLFKFSGNIIDNNTAGRSPLAVHLVRIIKREGRSQVNMIFAISCNDVHAVGCCWWVEHDAIIMELKRM